MAIKFDKIAGQVRESDVYTLTKTKVEAVLTGEIDSHSHSSSGGLTQPQILARTLGS